LLSFYQNNWQGKKCTIFISGNISDTEVALIDKYFGSISLSAKLPQQSFSSQLINDGQSMVIEKPEAIQSSIRMGKKLMNRKNPDYFSMLVLNELLGGYFGSRLMKNIREEKGLTYGISSNVAAFTHAGYFVIGTDVKKEFTQQTIDEIHKEIIILQTQLVEDSELQTVKNYMVGSFAGSLNTPFDIADRYKVILLDELPTNFYQNYITNIQSVTAQKVIEMANKYLAIDSLTEVVVGGK
jgi:predicted Zn-dependent peptidase